MTADEAMDKLLETLQMMQMTSIKQNIQITNLTDRVSILEDANMKILFFIETIMDESPKTYH